MCVAFCLFKTIHNLHYEQIGKEVRCIEDELPFEIPDSWEWGTLNSCTDVRDGTHDTPKYCSSGYPLITSKNLIDGKIDFSTAKLISEDDYIKINQRSKVNTNDILFAMIGSIGNPVLYLGNEEFSIKNMALFKSIYRDVDMNYINLFLDYEQNNMRKQASGGVQSFVSLNYLRNYRIPLPPFKEQMRIVNKIKELEPLIRNYKIKEEQLFLLNSNIKEQLKKSILQFAIEGKLVPQDPNDEPASVLLERIREEKQKLIAEGKIKKDKNESVIYRRDNSYYEKLGDQEKCIDDQIPFEIPDNWCWTRLGNIGETNIGLTYKPSDITDSSGTLVLRSSNIKNNNMCYLDNVYVSCSIPEKSQIHKNDLLICARNGSRSLVGKSAIFDREEAAFGAFMAKFCSDYNHYVKLFLDSPLFRLRLEGVKTETINQITQFNLKQQLLPFPPIREQQRIIEKIAEISNLFEL